MSALNFHINGKFFNVCVRKIICEIGEKNRDYVYPDYRVLFYYKIADSHPAQMSFEWRKKELEVTLCNIIIKIFVVPTCLRWFSPGKFFILFQIYYNIWNELNKL